MITHHPIRHLPPRWTRWWPLLLVAILIGCDSPPPATTATQPATRSTLHDWVLEPSIANAERDQPCIRLLSAAPNLTETCCALGLEPCLVGRTRFCTYPPSVQTVPSIGALNDLNVETLLNLKPDRVLVSGTSRNITQRLTRLRIPYESLPDTALEDLFITVNRIGASTGRPETARKLTENIRADLAAIAARFATEPPARVLLLTGPMPDPPTQVFAAGPGSFYDDLLRMAGHTNVARAGGRPFAPLSLEFILQSNPDVIVELAPDARDRTRGDADALRAWSHVGQLTAVTDHRVHVIVGPQHFVLGPRVTQTFETLCQTIASRHHE